MHFMHNIAWMLDKYVKMASNFVAGRVVTFRTEDTMTGNSRDKVYIRADDICFSLVALFSSLSLSFFSLSLYLIVHPFYCILLEMSRDKALLTLLSRASPLRECFRKEYLVHEELVLPSYRTSNEHPKLCDTFNFIYITVEDIHFRDDACEIVVLLYMISSIYLK